MRMEYLISAFTVEILKQPEGYSWKIHSDDSFSRSSEKFFVSEKEAFLAAFYSQSVLLANIDFDLEPRLSIGLSGLAPPQLTGGDE